MSNRYLPSKTVERAKNQEWRDVSFAAPLLSLKRNNCSQSGLGGEALMVPDFVKID